MNAAPPEPGIPGATSRTVTIATADAGPLDLHVREIGTGDPVLLLHGWPQHGGCWRHVAEHLQDEFRLIAPDLRGFGHSAVTPGGYDPVTFASDAAALLDALEIDRAFVIGHDWGGSAAFALGLRRPDRVRAMLVLNTAPPWVRVTPRLLATAWRSWYAVAMATVGPFALRRRPDLLAAGMRRDAVHRDGLTAPDARAYVGLVRRRERLHATTQLYRTYLRVMTGRGATAELSQQELTVPTHFLFGTNDGAISPLVLEGVEAHGHDLVVERVADSGHFICEEKPELVARRARERFTA